MISVDEDDEWEFNEAYVELELEGLYRPDCYAEGESLCLEILEEIDFGWEPARLYLLLFLSAQDVEDEALNMIDDLQDESLFEALRHLAFGAGTTTEELVYEDIVACCRARGLSERLEEYFATQEKPLARQDIRSTLASWD